MLHHGLKRREREREREREQRGSMNSVVTKVAVVGSGISGAVCAAALARNGVSVTVFDSARGPGGRMSQRRELSEDGKELSFDHGAPFFSATNTDVLDLIHGWEARGLVAEWKENFGMFDPITKKFVDFEKTDMNLAPKLDGKLPDIPVNSCFALMLAFAEPLSSIPVKGFSLKDSEVLSWAYCDSSKPGRSAMSECWVLHSTMEYARGVISQTGLRKPSNATLTKVAEELFQEFQSTGLNISQPFFMKAHRWGSAFPAASIAREEKCLWDKKKRLAICGDFCVSPNVEGAILSGMAAASKLTEILCCL